MSVRRAVIIIGSNSTRLLCANMDAGLSFPLRGRENTRLFSCLENGVLPAAAIERAVQAVRRLKDAALQSGAARVDLLATSATRDARNKEALAQALKERAGLPLIPISGEEEARLSFLGASAGWEGPCGVIDVGGGSTEVALGRKGQALRTCSLQLGASRMLALRRVDSLEDMGRAVSAAGRAAKPLEGLMAGAARPERWFIVGGTGTTLARMLLGLRAHEELPAGFSFTLWEAGAMLRQIAPLSPAQRARVPGLPPERADIMPTGLAILLAVMRAVGAKALFVSERNNTDGYLLSLLEGGSHVP